MVYSKKLSDAQVRSRQVFFDRMVHQKAWKDAMSGKNEDNVIQLLRILGYELDKDFVRQHPIGEKFVIDFAFVNLRFAIEADGENHNSKKQRKSDEDRDSFLRSNGWVTIRVKDKDLFGYRASFYKNLIKEVVEERMEQYQKGELYHIDIPAFNEDDYE